jgi:hypothetical protein
LAFTAQAQLQAMGPLPPEATEAYDLRKNIVRLLDSRLRMLDIEMLRIIDDYFGGLWADAMRSAKTFLLPEHLFQMLGQKPVEDDYQTEAEEQAAIALEEPIYERIYKRLNREKVKSG